MQTTSKRIDKLDVIDGIVVCQPDEVQQVMKVFEIPSNSYDNLVPTDFNHLKKALQFTRPAQFIQATIRAINQILNQIPKDINVNVPILRIKTDSDVSLKEYFVVSSAIEERVSEDISLWYGNGITDESNYLCIEAVMNSEKSTYINIKKTTKDVLYE